MLDEAGKGRDLEAKAVVLMRQYGFFVRGPAKDFFKELAEFLGWEKLRKELK